MTLLKYIIAPTICLVFSVLIYSRVMAVEQGLDIEFDQQKESLSVNVNNVSLTEILKVVEEKSNCQFFLFGSNIDAITDSFSGLSLIQGIQRLAKDYSLAVIYMITDAPGNTKKIHTINQIWLFEGGSSPLGAMEKPIPSTALNKISPNQSVLLDINKQNTTVESNSKLSSKQNQVLSRPLFDDETEVGFWAKQLFEASDHDTKEQSITELQRIGSDEAVVAITTVLGDSNTRLRKHAVESLKMMDTEKSTQIIAQALLGDADASVRKVALDYFIDRQDQVSRAFLNTALQDSDTQIRKLARKALNEF